MAAKRTVSFTTNPRRVIAAGIPGLQGPPGLAGASYQATFTQASLSIVGKLPVTHNLGVYPAGVEVWDASGERVDPDAIEYVSQDAIAIDLISFQPISGTWRVSITT